MAGINTIKEIANKIAEEISSVPFKELGEFESYIINDYNTIIGCKVSVGNYTFLCEKTIEKGIYKIYAENSKNGSYSAITVDSHGNKETLKTFIYKEFGIDFSWVNLFFIGRPYKSVESLLS